MPTDTLSPLDQDERFGAIVYDLLQAAERGESLDRDGMLAEHPEFADELAEFFASQDSVQRLADPVRYVLAPTSPP